MGIKQYTVGKEWEEEIMDYYNSRGYYTYKFPTDFNGTICDILVSRNGTAMFIEAKHVIGDKLRYKTSGIYKKRDELNNLVNKYNNNIYIMIKSDKCGVFWTTWINAKPIFEQQGYLDLEKDCFKCKMETRWFDDQI